MINSFKLFILLSITTLACNNLRETPTEPVGFKLMGSLNHLPDSIPVLIMMTNMDTDETDSTYLQNRQFRFKGKVSRPTPFEFIGINLTENRLEFHEQVFIDNNEFITLEQNKKYGNAEIKGSKINDEKKAYYQQIHEIRNKYKRVLDKEEFNKQDSIQLIKYISEVKQTKTDFYLQNRSSYFTGYQMMYETLNTSKFNVQLSKNELSEIYSMLSNEVKNSIYGQAIYKNITKPEIPHVGDKCLDFRLSDSDGNNIRLSDFKGKYVLVDFWASWCAPCRVQNPELVTLYSKYNTYNFEILGVSIDNQYKKWLEAIKEDSLLWTNVRSNGKWFSDVSQLYGITSIPDNLLIDPDGIIISRKIETDELTDLLESIFEKD